MSRPTRPLSSPSPPIIDLSHVTVYRGDVPVLLDLSLEVPSGCHTAILGPNGSGKSTLLKLFTRELYPVDRSSSWVKLFGEERWDVWELRRRLGLVSLDLQIEYAGWATGREVVLSGYVGSIGLYEPHRLSEDQRAHAGWWMDRLGVSALAERPFARLSTGEQRRLLFARALIHDPEALVLDEPTTGLDPRACTQYLSLVRSLIREGKTVIVVTHHLHEIPPEVRRVVLLKEGRVVGDGAKDQLLTTRRMSDLFGADLEVTQVNGFYQVTAGRVEGGAT
ncbi:ABC transporter ATP-binding protein [Candidatus Nitrospira bockiana]